MCRETRKYWVALLAVGAVAMLAIVLIWPRNHEETRRGTRSSDQARRNVVEDEGGRRKRQEVLEALDAAMMEIGRRYPIGEREFKVAIAPTADGWCVSLVFLPVTAGGFVSATVKRNGEVGILSGF